MGVLARIEKENDAVDALPKDLRECAHDYGYIIVSICLKHGIRNPVHIRELVSTIWEGARQPAQRTSVFPGAPKGAKTLEWLLVQRGVPISAREITRVLLDGHLVILPLEPSPQMVEASIDLTNHVGVVSKTKKHLLRLRSAIRTGVNQHWPHLGVKTEV